MAPSFIDFDAFDYLPSKQALVITQGDVDLPEHRLQDDHEPMHEQVDIYEPGRTKIETHGQYAFEDLKPNFPDLK